MLVEKNYSSKRFSPKDTLTCGQVFRYTFDENANSYCVFSRDKRCFLSQSGSVTKLKCEEDDLPYFENYFDLSRNYDEVVEALSVFPELKDAAAFSGSLRILRQGFEETGFLFIISANNNIKRIQSIIEKLCRAVGDDKGDYSAFPTAMQLQSLSINNMKEMGLGYRAEYIYDACRAFPIVKEKILTLNDDEDIYNALTGIKGVGPKVAGCIMLFGLNRTAAYPVDTWIFKSCKTDELDTPKKVQAYYSARYGEYAGFAQQYIFHYNRNGKK